MEFDDAELEDLYLWVDDVPLSRPKRYMTRDFSDGVLVAEVVKHFQPRLVDLHNYSPANGLAQKLYNWSTLNQKVFRRLGFVVRHAECEAVATCTPGAVEKVLKQLRTRLAEYDAAHPAGVPASRPGSPGRIRNRQSSEEDAAGGDEAGQGEPAVELPWGEQAALLKIEQQEGEIADLRAENEELRAALARQDERVAALDAQLQGLLAKGMRNCNIIRPARPLAERTPNSLPRAGNSGHTPVGGDIPPLAF